ncbi:MAG: HD domain-containing protein [Alkalispirochaeta sp.]
MRLPELDTARIHYRFLGTTALDRFLDLPEGPVVYVAVDAGVVELASIFDHTSFPGLPGWDLLVEAGGREVVIRDDDRGEPIPPHLADPLSTFSWDPRRRAFGDPSGLYPVLKEARRRIRETLSRKGTTLGDVEPVDIGEYPEVRDVLSGIDGVAAAVYTARLPIVFPRKLLRLGENDPGHPATYHRFVVTGILTGPWAERGLELLRKTGYTAAVLPELDVMHGTEHSKEGHPEGDVWRHSIETLRYRKTRDLTIALALLFHDSGKPRSRPQGHKKFDGHADIGAGIARDVLERLEFAPETVDAVRWLVKYHMIPGALRRLPDHRRDPIMRSELFPLLLEVYRCDLSSTFRGPENYYDACAIYRRFLKSNRDPASGSPREFRDLVNTYLN